MRSFCKVCKGCPTDTPTNCAAILCRSRLQVQYKICSFSSLGLQTKNHEPFSFPPLTYCLRSDICGPHRGRASCHRSSRSSAELDCPSWEASYSGNRFEIQPDELRSST